MHQAVVYIFTFELRIHWNVSGGFVVIAWDDLYILKYSTLSGPIVPSFCEKALQICVSQYFCMASLLNVCMSVNEPYILYSLNFF